MNEDTMKKSFTVKSENLKQTDEGKRIIEVPISSESMDRDGDKISEEGLKAITRQIVEDSVPMFPNHGIGDSDSFYGFEDIMGEWFDAEKDDGVVTAKARLRENNKFADELEDLLKQEMPVGFSIGFHYEEEDVKENNSSGKVFEDMDLVEISPVGIPSNPDARVELAQSIAKQFTGKNVDLKEAKQVIKNTVDELKNKDELKEGQEEDKLNEKDIIKYLIKPFGPWEDFDDCKEDMMDQGYDEESAENICGYLEQELEGLNFIVDDNMGIDKQDYDLNPMTLIEEFADQFGLEVSDVNDLVSEDDFEGSLNVRAGATADILGTDTGTVLDMYEELSSEEEQEQGSEEGNEDEDEGDEEESDEPEPEPDKSNSNDDDSDVNKEFEEAVNELQEELKEIKEENQELQSQVKKLRSRTRESDKKGITPTESDSMDVDEEGNNGNEDEVMNLGDEAKLFGQEGGEE